MDILQKIGPKRSFLREIRAQTFFTPLFALAVAIACCVPGQILKNTANLLLRVPLDLSGPHRRLHFLMHITWVYGSK